MKVAKEDGLTSMQFLLKMLILFKNLVLLTHKKLKEFIARSLRIAKVKLEFKNHMMLEMDMVKLLKNI
jgi:hypothetical protein